MNKIFTHTILFILIAAQLFGQSEWIKQDQVYFKIPVIKTGTYQITNAELSNLNIPVDSIQPADFHIFRCGKKIPLTFKSGNIIFDAQKNEGEGDSALYMNPASIPKTRYSLYSDTAAYFLIWQKDFLEHDSLHAKVADNPASVYQFEELVHSYHSHYNPGAFYPPGSGFENGSALSDYDEGEGWTGPEIKAGDSVQIAFETKIPEAARGELNEVEIAMTGWAPGAHHFAIHSNYGNRILGEVEFEDYQSRAATFSLTSKDFNAAGKVELTVKPAGANARAALTYSRLTFPKPDNIPAENLLKVPALIPIVFPKTDTTTFDYLIITHSTLSEVAETYAAYRRSFEGGNLKVRVLLVSDIYNQFNFGDPGPAGLRRAIAYFHEKHGIRFVFLIGASVDPQKARKSKVMLDLVPNAGWPGSDVALAMQPGSLAPPLVAIGRINATEPQQVLDYLDKVRAMEAQPASSRWRRRVLHLSGGRSRDELAAFRSYLQDFENTLSHSKLQVKISTISKETANPVERLPVENAVNEGVALVTLFGHSGTNATDLDIGFVTDPERTYANHPHYPAVIVNGCASGSIFYTPKTLSSDWIFAPNAGAVLFLAHTSNGVSTALKRYTGIFYEVLADTAFSNKAFGEIQREAIRRNLAREPDIYDRITVQQMNLHGDPAIQIFPKIPPGADTTFYEPVTNSPPAAVITIDGRLLQNHDYVSAKPVIGIQLIEPAARRSSGDTTGISIWLKRICTGCKDFRLSLSNARWQSADQQNWYIEVPYQTALQPGTYLLTTQIRNLNGCFAPAYQVTFQVSDENPIPLVTVSPNPSKSWFRFQFKLNNTAKADYARLQVFDLQGTKINEEILQVQSGLNEAYWLPKQHSAGLYTYRLGIFSEAATGKLAAETVLTGRLLWVP